MDFLLTILKSDFTVEGAPDSLIPDMNRDNNRRIYITYSYSINQAGSCITIEWMGT